MQFSFDMLETFIKITIGLIALTTLLLIPKFNNKFTKLITTYKLSLKNQFIFFLMYCIFSLLLSLVLDSFWSLKKIHSKNHNQLIMISTNIKVHQQRQQEIQQYSRRLDNFVLSLTSCLLWLVFCLILTNFSQIQKNKNQQNQQQKQKVQKQGKIQHQQNKTLISEINKDNQRKNKIKNNGKKATKQKHKNQTKGKDKDQEKNKGKEKGKVNKILQKKKL